MLVGLVFAMLGDIVLEIDNKSLTNRPDLWGHYGIAREFAAIFDNCELQWKTYANDTKNNAKVGYIVAPKTSPYVFRNCIVTLCIHLSAQR